MGAKAKENGMRVLEVAHHRNGISGAPFYAVRFELLQEGESRPRQMMATVFPEFGQVAVIDIDLAKSTVEFGVNSWRGDHFEARLRSAIERYEKFRSEWLADQAKPMKHPFIERSQEGGKE